MRMRRKSNLDERINSSSDFLIACEHEFTNSLEYIKEKDYIDFKKLFANDNPIEIDLGCGLGAFLVKKAKQCPNINFIGVEKFSNIIISAIDKIRAENIKNVKFINCRVECIEKFIPNNSISKIYLNFSNPLNNVSDEKKRLTYKRFLEIYKKILKENGVIIQKTDNRDFFEYSIESFKQNGFLVDEINYDLVSNPVKDNIETEHEKKYILDGRKIHRLKAVLTPFNI